MAPRLARARRAGDHVHACPSGLESHAPCTIATSVEQGKVMVLARVWCDGLLWFWKLLAQYPRAPEP